MLKCSQCSKEFKYVSEKKRHEESHIPKFECKVCLKTFSFMSALRRHEKQHNRSGKVQCKDCDRFFRDEILLNRHINYAHKGTYACVKCSAIFSSEIALQTHAKTHNPVSERKYHCSYKGCNKAFNFSHHLKHHELTHTDTKQHFCGVCGKGFIQSHHLKSHLKRHGDTDNLLPCTVLYCNKKFITQYSRRRHIDSHNAITCCKCGLLVQEKDCKKHLLSCKVGDEYAKTDNNVKASLNSESNLTDDIIIKSEGVPIKNLESLKLDVTSCDINDDISNCNNILGSCIVSGDSVITSDCLCAQISDPVTSIVKSTSSKESVEITKEIYNSINSVSDSTKSKSVNGLCTQMASPGTDIAKPISSKENFEIMRGTYNSINLVTDSTESKKVNSFYRETFGPMTGIASSASSKESVVIKKQTYNSMKYVSDSTKLKSINRFCDGCKHADICTSKSTVNIQFPNKCPNYVKDREYSGKFEDDTPEIERRSDGTIKLKQELDLDFTVTHHTTVDMRNEMENQAQKNSDTKSILMNSCKAVLGNCIVSEDGTIGEGCLCAKIGNNNQPMNEEIDEITPHPEMNFL